MAIPNITRCTLFNRRPGSRLRAGGALALAALACGTASACGADAKDSGFGDSEPRGSGADGGGNGATAGGGSGGFGAASGGGGQSNGGSGDPTCAATSVKAQKAAVDIIFFVDTSTSMTIEITQIKTNINNFANSIGQSGLDFQVIMIARRGIGEFEICVPPPLGGANCGDNPPRFRHVPQAIGSTDGLENVLSSYDETWKAYVRPDAYKAFVAITDDDSELSSTEFDLGLLAKAPAGMFGTATQRRYIMNSICGWKEGTAPLSKGACPTAENIGANYQRLSQLTNGVIDSVCKKTFDSVFNNIANGIVTRLGCELTVPASGDAGTADPGKVAVQYTAGATGATERLVQVTDASKCAQIPNGWYFDDNASPTKIVLCPAECAAVGADTSGKLDVLVGCRGESPR